MAQLASVLLQEQEVPGLIIGDFMSFLTFL